MFYSDCRPNLFFPGTRPLFFLPLPLRLHTRTQHTQRRHLNQIHPYSIPNVDNSIRSIRARVNLSHNGQGGQVSPHLPKHRCPQPRGCSQRRSHGPRLQTSKHFFVHCLCGHFHIHLSLQAVGRGCIRSGQLINKVLRMRRECGCKKGNNNAISDIWCTGRFKETDVSSRDAQEVWP